MINKHMCNNLQFIRGQRILNQLSEFILFEQSTYDHLYNNVLKYIPVTSMRQLPNAVDPVQINKVEVLPFLGTKNLNVKTLAVNQGKSYSPNIIFNNVVFEDEDTNENVTFTAKNNQEYHMQQIDLTQHNVRVNCQCLDFRYRFAYFNAKDKSLVGSAPPPYQRISNRGPVNPQKVPGVCKHIIASIKALQHSGMVK